MSRPQGEPCYGAACDCRRCQNLKNTLAPASGTREEAMRLRFISRLRSMEIVLMFFLVLLIIRIIHLHRQTPEFFFTYLQSSKSTITLPSKPPPTPRQGIDNGMVSMTRNPGSMLRVDEGYVSTSGYQSPWVILPNVNLESEIASTPHLHIPTRYSNFGSRPSFKHEALRKTYAWRPVGE